ncbi:MAG: Sulfurtransferase TusA [Solirubrobacteraceae bacterium]|jgi:tRNA 2-thiouridine synthesizing protein A|nr:Sulfurtransferase TusA [Solirubrobacteraceae bacterium]
MERELDVRGLRCPVPYARARPLAEALAPGDVLHVLATDPEAPVDLGALAADEGLGFEVVREDGALRITLSRNPAAHRG